MSYTIEIYVDWNTQDDSGLPWTLLDQAADPSRVRPGAYLIAGHDDAMAVVEVVDVDTDGVVHVRQLPGSVSANAHRLTAPVS
ncbi:MAG: hypothetical protein ACRD0Q_08720 [Acidimicrobiales bacterium]